MSVRTVLHMFFGVVLVGVLVTSPVGAIPNAGKTTYFTFNKAVQLPGVALPPGTYVFEIANPDSSHRVVRVTRRDTGRVYFAGFTQLIPRPVDLPADQHIRLGEGPRGAAVPVAAWYPSGQLQGHRFIYQ